MKLKSKKISVRDEPFSSLSSLAFPMAALMPSVSSQTFRSNVDDALTTVGKVLGEERARSRAVGDASVKHGFADKYAAVELGSRAMIVSSMLLLERLGLARDKLDRLLDLYRNQRKTITLRFCVAERTCSLLRTETREVEDPTKTVTTGVFFKTTRKTVRTVTRKVWRFRARWELVAFAGTGDRPEDRVQLDAREGTHDFLGKAGDGSPPYPASAGEDACEMDLTWLLSCVDESKQVRFGE